MMKVAAVTLAALIAAGCGGGKSLDERVSEKLGQPVHECKVDSEVEEAGQSVKVIYCQSADGTTVMAGEVNGEIVAAEDLGL